MAPPTVNTDEDRRRIGVFMRQYLQMIDPAELTYPPGQLIKSVDVQSFLVDHMFDRRRWRLPPARYSFRVMKKLISIITVAISNPEQDVSIPRVPQPPTVLMAKMVCLRNYPTS